MKKILSLTLALLMVVSAVPMVHAAGNWEDGTEVTYSAAGTEEWTVTVPAQLAPGGSGDVTASGTWADNRKLVVEVNPHVIMGNDMLFEEISLMATFDDINLLGSNTEAVSQTNQISVADFESAPLFGNWSGHITYYVEMVDLNRFQLHGLTTYYADPDMTWREWVDSDYNDCGVEVTDDGLVLYDGSYLTGVTADDVIVDGQTYVNF